MNAPEWDAPSATQVINDAHKVEEKISTHLTNEIMNGACWNGERGEVWNQRIKTLDEPCNWNQDYLKNGIPRVKIEGGSFRSKPRWIALQKHRSTLVELFPAPFTQKEDPKGIFVFSLCGYSNCVNPNHLPIMFRTHLKGLDALRVEMDGVDGWWSGAEYFYTSYEAYLYQDGIAEKTAGEKRSHQRRVQAKISRRKRKYTEGERARAITMLSDGTITYEMYKELKAIFLGLSEDVFDQTMIIYATRAKAIRDGNISAGYIPDARTNPFKNYKG